MPSLYESYSEGSLLPANSRLGKELNRMALKVAGIQEEKSGKKKFSLFSDFSLSLIVSAAAEDCAFEIDDVLVRSDPQPGADTGAVLGRLLEKQCAAELLGRNRLSAVQLSQLCYINLYEPMYQMKGRDLGLDARRMATAGIAHWGHCYGADPFVGMKSFFDAAPVAGGVALLCASSRLCTGMALIRDRSKRERG